MTKITNQHVDDVEIPVIEISPGWAAEDCKTHDQCNDAFAYLMSAVASIEYQIDIELIKPKEVQDGQWLASARCALKYKKAALQIVNQQRSEINSKANEEFKSRRDQKLLTYIRSVVPSDQFMEWIRGSGITEDAQREAA